MTREEQLNKWVDGISVHNDEDGEEECCPDFSCCRPQLMATLEQRILFRDHPEHRTSMLGMFLQAALELSARESGERLNIHVIHESDNKTVH